MEIGAGGAWLGAELSKLPNVVEVIVTDLSPLLLQEEAPKVFELLQAHSAKITRTPGDFHKLDFPNNHFDFVVCSAVLHDAAELFECLAGFGRNGITHSGIIRSSFGKRLCRWK